MVIKTAEFVISNTQVSRCPHPTNLSLPLLDDRECWQVLIDQHAHG